VVVPPHTLSNRFGSVDSAGAVQVGPMSAACSSAPRISLTSSSVLSGAGSLSSDEHPANATMAPITTAALASLPIASIGPS
jgi:hypothetical protein